MTEEVVVTRTIKGWNNEFTIQVIKGSNWIMLTETHTGPVPDTHCVEVIVSLSMMEFTWEDRRFKTRAKVGFTSHIALFQAAEDVFVKLLSQHLKHEYNGGGMLGRGKWQTIRHALHSGLRQFVPKKEADERVAKRDRDSVLRRLGRAKMTARLFGYSHIASELTRLIEEVKKG